jgi:8-oxo-dGTP diphosphatase
MNYSGPSSKPHDSGVAATVFMCRGKKIFLMKRAGSTGEGTWAIPGGKLEFKEHPLHAAVREIQEETGVELSESDLELIGYTNDIHEKEQLHFVSLTFIAKNINQEPRIMEPNKCTEMGWFDIADLPSPLYLPTKHKITQQLISLLSNTEHSTK